MSNQRTNSSIMSDTTIDFELIKNFVNGDESSFNKLVNRYQKKIYWHARKMTGNHLDAEEVVQEVLLVIYNKLKDFKFESNLYTWIYRITATRSINFINKRKIKNLIFFDEEEGRTFKSNVDIVRDLENKEKLEKLDRLLQKLPVKQREVFIMRSFENLSYEEMSEITGKSVGGLKANYFHALNKINNLMGK